MLQKVAAISIFATRKFVARRGGNTGNKQSQLATQNLLRDKLQENVARITYFNGKPFNPVQAVHGSGGHLCGEPPASRQEDVILRLEGGWSPSRGTVQTLFQGR